MFMTRGKKTENSEEDYEPEPKFDPLLEVKTELGPLCEHESFETFQCGNQSSGQDDSVESTFFKIESDDTKTKTSSKRRKGGWKVSTASKNARRKLQMREKRAAEAFVKCHQELQALEALLDTNQAGQVDPVVMKVWEFVEFADGSKRRKRVDEMTTEEQLSLRNLVQSQEKLRKRQLKEAQLEEKRKARLEDKRKMEGGKRKMEGEKRKMEEEKRKTLGEKRKTLGEKRKTLEGNRHHSKARTLKAKEKLQVLEIMDSQEPGERCQVDPEVVKSWEVLDAPDGSKRRKRADEMTPQEQISLAKRVRTQEQKLAAAKWKKNRIQNMTPEQKEKFRSRKNELTRKKNQKLREELGVEVVRSMRRSYYHSMAPETKKSLKESYKRYYQRKREELEKEPERLLFLNTARRIQRQKKVLEEREKKGITKPYRFILKKAFPELPPDEMKRMEFVRQKQRVERLTFRRRLQKQGLPPEEIQKQVNALIEKQNSLLPSAGKPTLNICERKRKCDPVSGTSTTPKKRRRTRKEKLAAEVVPSAASEVSCQYPTPNPLGVQLELGEGCHQRNSYVENYVHQQVPIVPPKNLQGGFPQGTFTQPSSSINSDEQFDQSAAPSYTDYDYPQHDDDTGGCCGAASPLSLHLVSRVEPTPPLPHGGGRLPTPAELASALSAGGIRAEPGPGRRRGRPSKSIPKPKTPKPGKDAICDECGQHLRPNSVAGHKRILHNPNYDRETRTCKLCGGDFLHAQLWYKHYMKDHQSPRTASHVCDQCGKDFSTSWNLTAHKKIQHDDASAKRLIKCPHCPKEQILKGKLSYQSHCRRYHPNASADFHKCLRCSQMFPNVKAMTSHMEEEHPESFFRCEWCPLVRHSDMGLRFHHRTCPQMPKQVKAELMKKGNEYFPEFYLIACELCGHKVTLNNLSAHYAGVHNVKEEPFKCFYCEKNFKLRPFWMVHMEEFHGHKLETFYDKLGLLNASNREGLRIKLKISPGVEDGENTSEKRFSRRLLPENSRFEHGKRAKKRRKIKVIAEEDDLNLEN